MSRLGRDGAGGAPAPAPDPGLSPTGRVFRPVVLMVLDGWGYAQPGPGNAVELAQTPAFDALLARWPHGVLEASGLAVGLPPGQMGNSEVGHLNIGAGRVVYQELTRITCAIEEGEFFANQVLKDALAAARERGSTFHLMGLVSGGGVHSDLGHLRACLEMARREGVTDVVVHAFLDGRDTPPGAPASTSLEVSAAMATLGVGRFGTVIGRYYAMDRDSRWDRVKLAYDAMVHGEGERAPDAQSALALAYARGENDEFVHPTVVGDDRRARVKDGDSCLFFNFRPDRARELTRALTEPGFDRFDRGPRPPRVTFTTMTQYKKEFPLPVAFPPEGVRHVLAEVLAELGLRQLHIAETEKYAHVTFFFNGGVEREVAGEKRILIPEPPGRGHLRREAADERLRGRRRAGAPARFGRVRLRRRELRQRRHGGTFGDTRGGDRRRRGRRRLRRAGGREGSQPGRRLPGHGRPRQLRQHGRCGRRARHRAQHQPGARSSPRSTACACATVASWPTSRRRCSTCSATRPRPR